MISLLRQELGALLDLVSPRRCILCGQTLAPSEQDLCVKCYMNLPRTGYHKAQHSFLETDYWGKIPIQRATAYFFYEEKNRAILFRSKYHSKPHVGEHLAQLMSKEILAESDFFQDIDTLVPIPLHPSRQGQRGYNQSHHIARGISNVTHIPLCENAVVRIINNESQTKLGYQQRKENVEGAFSCIHPELLRGKHILIVDDVITTGATTTACAQAILQALGEPADGSSTTTFSIISLATATPHRLPMKAGDSYRYDEL